LNTTDKSSIVGLVDLSEARRIAGLSQLQLDDLAGLTRGTVADIERGKNKNPSHETVTRLVRALKQRGFNGLSAEELFPVPQPVAKRRASA
jgi:transcriptional regulator with XRE-family HTH domain